jgi:hypothetical protein
MRVKVDFQAKQVLFTIVLSEGETGCSGRIAGAQASEMASKRTSTVAVRDPLWSSLMNRTSIAIVSAITAAFLAVGCASPATDEAADEAAYGRSFPTLVDCSEGGEGFLQLSGDLPVVQGAIHLYTSEFSRTAGNLKVVSNRRGSLSFTGTTTEGDLSTRKPMPIRIEVDGIDFTRHPQGRLSDFNVAASVRITTPEGTSTLRKNCIVAPLLKSLVR